MKKILFVAQNFNIGGLQKSFVNTVKKLHEEGYQLDVFSLGTGALQTELPKEVPVRIAKKPLQVLMMPLMYVKNKYGLLGFLLRCFLVLMAKVIGIKRLYCFLLSCEKIDFQYDIAVSFFNDIFSGVSNRGTNWFVTDFVRAKKKVTWLHLDVFRANFNRNECVETYKGFDAIACVSETIKKKFDEFLPQYQSKTCVVNNYFPVEKINRLSEHNISLYEPNVFNIITVGRIENHSKRMDRIVRICALLKEDGVINFKWRIIGDGPDLKSIEKMIEKYGVSDVLKLFGNKENPYPYIKQSQLFALTSEYEGYPMVVGEALVLGIPVITTKFEAAKEMVIHGENGMICSMEEKKFAESVKRMIQNKELYHKIKNSVERNEYVNKYWKKQISRVLEEV